MSIKRLIFVGMSTFFLSACGGGGGSDDAVSQAPSGAVDTTPPVITLLGESPMTIEQGQAYEEPGATAEDDVDGAVDVIIEGEVEDIPGDYEISYSASDAAGNRATAERLVTVTPRSDEGVLGLSPQAILERLSLEQKLAQLIQAEISSISLDDIRELGIGSVLNGGGSYPGGNRAASVSDWRTFAEAMREASLDTSGGTAGIPIVWGTDAVHGHNNVRGATLYPHNIGLGATRDTELIRAIGEATATSVAATGVDWIFGPTVAQAQDYRWGRSYESYSDDSDLVERFAYQLVEGIQSVGVAATAKHFIGDGGTARGIDQGNTNVSDSVLLAEHGSGYEGAIAADVLSVMATFNSVRGEKVHGSYPLLTDMLRGQLGFEGMVVSDWNGIAQVPGCNNASCPAAINAGIDMSMTPFDWRSLLANLIQQVERGDISQSRIDEAVLRVLTFKQRLGLLDPDFAVGRGVAPEVLGSEPYRELARRAVRRSLVLLKNNKSALPIAPSSTIVLVGDAANSIPHQAGGWSVTWQGTDTSNADFPGGTTILEAMQSAVASSGGSVHYFPDGDIDDAIAPDAIVAVLAENPYAEGAGDLADLNWPNAYSVALERVQSWRTNSVPVTTVFLTGRPMWINPEINDSDAVAVAWLPGTEAQGITDVLLSDSAGEVAFDFTGVLPFPWPGGAVNPRDAGLAVEATLFPREYGLTYQDSELIDELDENPRNNKDGLVGPEENSGAEPGNEPIDTLWVFRNGQVEDTWDRGIGAFDEAIGWGVCENDGGAGCPSIDWGITSDSDHGQVLEITYPPNAAFAGLFIESLDGIDISDFDHVAFDIKHLNGDNQYAIKLDCFHPCSSGDYLLNRLDDGWQSVSVSLDQLEAQGLVSSNVNTGLVIWPTEHNNHRFRLDNIRFTKLP